MWVSANYCSYYIYHFNISVKFNVSKLFNVILHIHLLHNHMNFISNIL